MKTKSFFYVAFLSILVSYTTSCSKDNDNTEPQPNGAILPSVITYTKSASAMPDATMYTVTTKFEYDVQDRISKNHINRK